MDPNSSIGKTCLGENVIEISSEKAEEYKDWNSPKYEDTANSGGKKEIKALIFHKMEIEEVSDRYVAPCFINGLEAYDGQINLGTKENMILNEFGVKLCLDHEVRNGRVVLGTSFMRLTKGIANFGNGTITIYPKLDPFLDSSGGTKKTDDEWDLLKLLTREEAAREALAIDICRIYSILEEERPVIETMSYSDKYKKLLDEICLDKMKLDGEMQKEEEEAMISIKREALIEEKDLGAFVISIQMEAKIFLNTLADTSSDINVMSYCVYKELSRREVTKVKRGITMLNHLKADLIGILKDFLCQILMIQCSRQCETMEEAMLPCVHHSFLLWEGCNQAAKSRYNTRLAQLLPRLINSPCFVDWNVLNQMGCGECALHEFYSTYEFNEVCADDELRTKKIIKFRLCGSAFSWTLLEFAKRLGLYHLEEIEEEGFDVYFQGGLYSDEHFNAQEYWLSISQEENLGLSRIHALMIRKPILRRKKLLSKEVLNSLSAPINYRTLDTTTHRELIDSEGRLIPEVPKPVVPRVAIPRPPKASIQDLYEMIGFTVFHCKEPRTHLDMISSSMTSIISSTHLSSSSSSQMMMTSVKMTRVGCVTACFGSRIF
nr:hypothetical protein [Tanacetum cinerariifolium]GEW08938.1 hypothetical protein [Tanacetum cinerariifolium]